MPKSKLPSTLEPSPVVGSPVAKEAPKKEETATVQAVPASPPSPAATDPVTKAMSSAVKPTEKSKKYLDLGAGYSISANEGSGYYILLKEMARLCHFESVTKSLETLNPSDKAQAEKILAEAIVDREVLEEAIRKDSSWESHAQTRIKTLKMLAKGKNGSGKAAENTLKNKDRVKGSKWVGNVREMLGVCVSSYPKSKNRNTKKFEDAGVVFRPYPILVLDEDGKAIKPRRSDKVCFMMIPAKHINVIRTCIETVHGIKEPREKAKDPRK